MTKYQRAKHKQLVEELKRRKAANEPNLTIRNGVIVTKHPYRGNQGNNSQPYKYYLIKNSQAVKKGAASKKAMVKKDVTRRRQRKFT